MMNHPYFGGIILNGFLIMNHFTIIMKILLIISSAIVILMAFKYYEYEKLNLFEFSILILLSV